MTLGKRNQDHSHEFLVIQFLCFSCHRTSGSEFGEAGKYIASVFNLSRVPSACLVPACNSRPNWAKCACKLEAPATRSSRLSKTRAPSSVAKKRFGEIKGLPFRLDRVRLKTEASILAFRRLCSRHVAKSDWSDIQVGVRIIPTKLE
jgi:hypothetical protein